MSEYHENANELPPPIREQHRAIRSLQEELEAVDWYHQRIAVTDDESLRAVLEHNRDEEIEHAAMLLEWLRRNMDGWDEELRSYLFTPNPITHIEDGDGNPQPTLGLGDLKGKE